MTRRDFLIRMIGAGAAALVLPKIELLAQAAVADAEAFTTPAWAHTFLEIHWHAFRRYRDGMAAAGFPVDPRQVYPGYRMGMVLPTGEMVAHNYNVTATKDELAPAVDPAIAALVQGAAFDGLDRYGVSELPPYPSVEYAGTVGPLRMISTYDLYANMMLVRFDVAGASSESGQRQVRRNRQAELKARILRGRISGVPVHKRIGYAGL